MMKFEAAEREFQCDRRSSITKPLMELLRANSVAGKVTDIMYGQTLSGVVLPGYDFSDGAFSFLELDRPN